MSKTISSERLDVVDALRGFALLGIVLTHFLEQFYAGPPPHDHQNYTMHLASDGFFDAFVNIMMRGKFFMLFSFLFGLSFFIQMSRADARGSNFSGRFVWRLVVLFAIGFVHNCFYRGDILQIYALVGVPLLLFYRANDWILLAAVAILMLGIPRTVEKIINPSSTAQFDKQDQPDNPDEVVYWETAKHGSWLPIAKANATTGFVQKMGFQFGPIGRGYQTFALFLLGLLAGRMGFFEDLNDKKRLFKRGLWWSLGSFVGLFLLAGILFGVFHLDKILSPSWNFIIGITLYDVANLAQTALYVFGFLLLFVNKTWWRRQMLKLAPFGRMALTNYVLQTLVGTFIFFGYGFGLLGDVGSTVAAALSIALFILQRIGSRWWLERYYFGPLEWLWRSLTFWKIQPFKK